jgi:pilus assembly protein CpaF
MVMMAGFDLPVRAIREQISSAIDIIVQATRLGDGSRKTINISEVTGMEGDIITLSPIFEFKQTGLDKTTGKIIGEFRATQNVPSFLDQIRAKGSAVNMELFK